MKGVDVSVVARPNSVGKFMDLYAIQLAESATPFLESEEWWTKVLTGIDTVIHLAWYAEPGKYLMADENLDCLTGTITIARAAANAGVRRFIGIGTCFEYDVSVGWLSVDTPLKPLTPYAASKASAYLTLSQWFRAREIEFSWCRLFYLYGEGEHDRRFVPYLRRSLAAGLPAELTAGMQVRDFLDVADAAEAICNVAFGSSVGPVNVCSGMPITIRAFAERIADEYGRRDLLKFGVREENIFDPPVVVGIK
ncbi:NAD(P)-dependent oxidoreductase [Rhizobium sp. BG4]|uniref:NAD-dependent epimerase/dehydratase family protein n=1 Tax=Rhizobium sp. BG4 TaxID=2613770 RepID=UPI001FEECCCE|nr:NAD(P)-dependent oxidoreductase [Rhizobium sp. BG4]